MPESAAADLPIFSRNDYAFAGPGGQTLPIAASQPVNRTGVNRGRLTAMRTVVGLAVRCYLVKGLTLGAVTGE